MTMLQVEDCLMYVIIYPELSSKLVRGKHAAMNK